MSRGKWVKKSSSYELQTPWLSVRKDAYVTPAGKLIDDFYILERKNFVVVVPRTLDGKYVLVSQYRHGVEKIVVNFPMGFIEKGEDAETAALREIKEEIGYVPRMITRLGTFKHVPSIMNTEVSIFLASDCEKPPNAEDNSEDPEIESVHLMEKAELEQFVASKEPNDAVSVLAYLLAKGVPNPASEVGYES